MISELTAATPIGPHRLRLVFNDGVEGELDFATFLKFDGVFELLRDPDYFARVTVDAESGTVVWPNGADQDPLVLHSRVTGKSVQFDLQRNFTERS